MIYDICVYSYMCVFIYYIYGSGRSYPVRLNNRIASPTGVTKCRAQGRPLLYIFPKKRVRAWRHSFLGPQQAFRVARVGSGLRYKVRYHVSLCLSSASFLPPFPLSAAMLGSLFICISGLMGFLLIPTVFNTRPAQKSSSTTVTKSCVS